MALFDNEKDTQVAIYAFNYVKVTNPSRKEYILQKINELNLSYTYNKFVLDEENNININTFIAVDNNFKPNLVWASMIAMYRALENEYSNFMKILWA